MVNGVIAAVAMANNWPPTWQNAGLSMLEIEISKDG
jgi:hypothetical protein